MSREIYTIGHSTRSIEDFIGILQFYKIQILVDVRTIPRSRYNPQYNADALENSLEKVSIHYAHLSKLGGLRHTTKDSIQLGWRNLSFRGFADYMQTPPFWEGIEELEKLGKKNQTVILCSEAVPWRCHRSLIADVLTVHHWKVLHILNKTSVKLHELTPFLKVKNGTFIYSAEEA